MDVQGLLGRVRAQDIAWLLLFSALAWVSPERSAAELELLAGLVLIQLVAPRVEAAQTPRGAVMVSSMKLLLGFLLIGVRGGLNSSYYPVLLLPVVSAATTLGIWGTAVFSALACGAQLCFVPMAERYFDYQLSSYELREQVLRIILLPIVGFLTWQLAEANRTEARRAQSVAGELAQANRNLQAAEAAVRRSERLAALGQLTAGLAHELRNPMGTMKASAEMLAKQVGSKSPVVAELAGYICSEVDRTNSLITRFLEFARPMKLRRSRADLNELIDQTVPRLERGLAKHGVHLVKNPAPDLRPLDMDAELMERVLANLITNAVQASSSGGTVTVKTGNVPGGVEVAVIDRGSGIKPEEMEQIFNPFYTTKKDGVGLGLAIVSKIVDEHGGRIHVDSEPGQGTQFAVFLPTQVSDSGTSGVRS